MEHLWYKIEKGSILFYSIPALQWPALKVYMLQP